ncbi:MAG: xanthine dehydrogenase family protein subunit M [Acidimicrobiales bacterium]|jgi:CO/xanthine dehydrogenase FAD-binding subunit|nr:carbon monoxide dehydrogenase [Acidimicrobiaceae bacterium]MDP6161766.1 xanthine dehydrogenase family protein subunit M [Acidimicrobiales bacterium]HJL92124.1 xanthine dehydrogenase family protein subunit M [Acidimicrobiales bacterium]HJO41412.1 xanthine dehydrogenase family protein subunit M [Acidimicrobiales bacterium]|tara:strand:- start:1990 stop:2844 length:855 start_codon:yes stop_codon:yes gene_type:complete
MGVIIAKSVNEACAVLAENPATTVLAGGTDLMVQANRGAHSLESVLDLSRIPELKNWSLEGSEMVLGAGISYTDLADPQIAALVPALTQAARTVGSPQIRNAGTLGGNLATASPAGDTIPVLVAMDAVLQLKSSTENREIAITEFITGVKTNALKPGEIIQSIKMPVFQGPQEFLKVGTRNAMVISVVSLALVTDFLGRKLRVGVGSVSPVPFRATAAEEFIAQEFDWETNSALSEKVINKFSELVADSTKPIDDHRGTADYRKHAVGVLAKRALERVCAGEKS